MVGNNKEILKNIVSLSYIKDILELGVGKKSTYLIRKILQKRKEGYCISLEDQKKWFDICKKINPDNKYGSIKLCKLLWENEKLRYNYETDKKFDLILIDGPSLNDNKYFYNKIKNEIVNDKNLWIDAKWKKTRDWGASSIHILEYVLPFCYKDTVILIDRRRSATYYYLQKYYDKNILDFYGLKTDSGWEKIKWIDGEIPIIESKHLKEKHYNIAKKFSPSTITFICFKNSNIMNKICKDLKIEVVNYLEQSTINIDNI